MNLGQFLKQKRIEKGLTMKELGEKIGKNKTFIYRLEKNNVKSLKNDVMEPLANALDIPVIALFDGFDENGNATKEIEQITRKEFATEVLTLLTKLDDITNQEKALLEHTINIISSSDE